MLFLVSLLLPPLLKPYSFLNGSTVLAFLHLHIEEELSAAPELASLQSPLFGGLRLQISIPDILGSAYHHILCPCVTLGGDTASIPLSDTWPNTSSSSCDGFEV